MKMAALCGVALVAGVVSVGAAVMASVTLAAASGGTTVTATGEIDGRLFEFAGPGECHYTTDGTIYDAPAIAWHASFRADGQTWSHANLSIWQLKAGGPVQLNLSARTSSGSYDIATVKKGTLRGSATGRAEKRGAGGVLFAEGTTAAGRPVKMSITCSRFEAPEDNG